MFENAHFRLIWLLSIISSKSVSIKDQIFMIIAFHIVAPYKVGINFYKEQLFSSLVVKAVHMLGGYDPHSI
jgi:hypothetical protein